MTFGALIGAYQEDDSGRLRALLPLAGRTLVEYQIRCATAAGAAPVVVIVERVPKELQDIFERLRLDAIPVYAVGDVHEAVSRFEAGSMILLIGDGVVAPVELIAGLIDEEEPAIVTVPDDEDHAGFERIDGESRWAGVAMIDAHLLSTTASMLGDWDLQSTLLRRAIQDGARRVPSGELAGGTILVEGAGQLDNFQKSLMAASKAVRSDWVSRFILPPVEDFATERLMETQVRPWWLVWLALGLTLGATFCFVQGWLFAGLALLVASTPLDLIAARLANLRLRPLAAKMPSRRLLWPAAGLAAVALGWWEAQHGQGWAPLIAAISACAFAEAARIEKAVFPPGVEIWLVSRRGAIFSAIPFAVFGAWTAFLVVFWLYAGASFFIVQQAHHRAKELTRS